MRIFLVGLLFLSTLCATPGFSQLGGTSTYSFLNLNSSARVAALGGNQIAVMDSDLNLAVYAPSLLTEGSHSQLSLSYVNYIADINFGYAAYAHNVENVGTFAASMQYMNYGKFTEADATGNKLGEFNASDYNLTFGYGREVDSLFRVGANLKVLYSAYERYTSFGLAADISGTFHKPGTGFTATAMIKNIGTQLKPYVEGNYEPLPFEVQLGISQRLKHAPLRLSLIGTNLQKWDLTYTDPNADVVEIDPLTGDPIEIKGPGFGDKLMRHVIVNAEFLLGKNIWLGLGYNHRQRQELKLADSPGLVGITFGAGVRVKQFYLNYGHANVHRAGASDYITISTSLNTFRSKG